MSLRAVSLFTNCGAGDVGFAKAGFRFEVLGRDRPTATSGCHSESTWFFSHFRRPETYLAGGGVGVPRPSRLGAPGPVGSVSALPGSLDRQRE